MKKYQFLLYSISFVTSCKKCRISHDYKNISKTHTLNKLSFYHFFYECVPNQNILFWSLRIIFSASVILTEQQSEYHIISVNDNLPVLSCVQKFLNYKVKSCLYDFIFMGDYESILRIQIGLERLVQSKIFLTQRR